jgi:hypothetical protein
MVVPGQAGKDLATLIRHYEYGRRSYGWVFDLRKFRNCMIYLPSEGLFDSLFWGLAGTQSMN